MNDDFVTIPVIEIVPGWGVDDIETIEECEDAHIKINALIAEIEFQMDIHDTKMPIDQNLEWYARAKRALKYKKIAAQCVNNTRARLAKKEKQKNQKTFYKQFTSVVRADVEPNQFDAWVRVATDRIECASSGKP